jgi:hypothetical protein
MNYNKNMIENVTHLLFLKEVDAAVNLIVLHTLLFLHSMNGLIDPPPNSSNCSTQLSSSLNSLEYTPQSPLAVALRNPVETMARILQMN